MKLFPQKPPSPKELLMKAQIGDAVAREVLLEENRLFIHKVTCHYCQKQLQWGQDDELSIAFLAFDEAIDKYKEERETPFLVFARLLIKHRLVDFFRREKKLSVISLGEEAWSAKESSLAWEKYSEEIIIRERQEEIKAYEKLLARYNLNLTELVVVTPKHKSARQQFIWVASLLAKKTNLFEHFTKTKKLPLKELEQVCRIKRKTLERHRKYIAAISLIFGYPEEFTYLYSHLKGLTNQGAV